jgi:hypothetical protein
MIKTEPDNQLDSAKRRRHALPLLSCMELFHVLRSRIRPNWSLRWSGSETLAAAMVGMILKCEGGVGSCADLLNVR